MDEVGQLFLQMVGSGSKGAGGNINYQLLQTKDIEITISKLEGKMGIKLFLSFFFIADIVLLL